MTESLPPYETLVAMQHGESLTIDGETLVMNREYPRIAFDCFDADGKFTGYLYPHNVEWHFRSAGEGA